MGGLGLGFTVAKAAMFQCVRGVGCTCSDGYIDKVTIAIKNSTLVRRNGDRRNSKQGQGKITAAKAKSKRSRRKSFHCCGFQCGARV